MDVDSFLSSSGDMGDSAYSPELGELPSSPRKHTSAELPPSAFTKEGMKSGMKKDVGQIDSFLGEEKPTPKPTVTPQEQQAANTARDRASEAIQEPMSGLMGAVNDAKKLLGKPQVKPKVSDIPKKTTQGIEDVRTAMIAPLQLAADALGTVWDLVTSNVTGTPHDFKQARKVGEEFSKHLIETKPSPSAQTALSLVSQGINVAGASLGVINAEFKRLFNRDMSAQEYQEVVDNSNYLAQVATVGYAPTKALATKGAAFVKGVTTAAIESAKSGKKVDVDSIDPSKVGTIKVSEKETPTQKATPPLKEPFTKEEVDKFKNQQKIQQEFMKQERVWNKEAAEAEEAAAVKQRQEEDVAWEQYRKQRDRAQQAEFAKEAERLKAAKAEEKYGDVKAPKPRAKVTSRAPWEKQGELYTLGGWIKGEDLLKKFINLGTLPEIRATTKSADDLLYTNRQSKVATESLVNELLRDAEKDGVTPEMGAKFRAFREGGTPLTKEEAALEQKYMVPAMQEFASLLDRYRELRGMPELDLAEDVLPRYAVGKGGFIDRFLALSESGLPAAFGFRKAPSAAKGRTIFALEHPDGSRSVVSLGKNNALVQWDNGTPTVLGKWEGKFELGKELEGGGVDGGVLKHATQDEAQAHTDVKYLPNSYEAVLRKSQELRNSIMDVETVNRMVNSPEFSSVVADEKVISREDAQAYKEDKWRPVSSRVQMLFPEFKDKLFEPNIAETIEDYLKPRSDFPAAKVYRALNNFLLKAMFLNPIPHINNEFMHWVPERGLQWVSPKGYNRLVKHGATALNSVLHQDALQREMLYNGASLFMPSIENEVFLKGRIEEQLKAAEKNPGFKELAKSIGMSPVELAKFVSQKSTNLMWTSRDVMYTQAILEHMDRLDPSIWNKSPEERAPTMKEAITEVERHMPSYRIPNRVLGSRALAAAMKNPYLTVFSYYHYGMVKSFAEFGRSLILDPIQGKGSPGKVAKNAVTAAGQLATIGLIYSMLYPASDKAFTEMLDRDVQARRAGGFALLENVKKAADEHDIDFETLLRTVISPAPVSYDVLSIFLNRDLFTMKPIHQPSDPFGRQATDLAKFIGTRPQPAQMGQKILTGKRTAGEIIGDYFMDVKDMSQQQKQAYFKLKDYIKTLRQRAVAGEEITEAEYERLYELERKVQSK